MRGLPRQGRSSSCPGKGNGIRAGSAGAACLAALLVLGLMAALPALAPARSRHQAQRASRGCVGATTTSASAARLARTMFCLHNVQRHRHHLGSLHWNGQLAEAAASHARDMARRHYFDHVSPDHRNHMDRIAATGYDDGVRCWSAGENLILSRGAVTPKQLITAFMSSPEHRHNILRGRWVDFGVGAVMSSPFGGPGVTLVALFGRLNPAC
jgi:uncharacterized protein YkwD